VANKFPQPAGSLSDDQKSDLRQLLRKVGATLPCSRCGANFDQFGLMPSTSYINLFDLAEAIAGVQELKIEALPIVCLNCGAVYQHALPMLRTSAEKIGDSATRGNDDRSSDV
jgi:hypothetical protein